jgi:hypothetical protein
LAGLAGDVCFFAPGPGLTTLPGAGVLPPGAGAGVLPGGAVPFGTPAPGTETGRTGAAIDQSINYAFPLTVLATDQWWNPVTGPTDVVHITCEDPLAQLPPDEAMVDGQAS